MLIKKVTFIYSLSLLINNSFANFTIKDSPALENPFTGEVYENILIGPQKKVLLKRNQIKRYITLYNEEQIIEDLDVPWIEEDCHDASDRFFNWSNNISIIRNYSGGIDYELLGLSISAGFDLSKEISIGYERWVQAIRGIKARHYLKKQSITKLGIILIQVKDINTQKTWFVKNRRFPKPFSIDNQSPGLFVEREVLSYCD